MGYTLFWVNSYDITDPDLLDKITDCLPLLDSDKVTIARPRPIPLRSIGRENPKMDSYKKDELRRRLRQEKLGRAREAREAPRKAYMAKRDAAAAEALAGLKANPDYGLIVEHLAVYSEDRATASK